VRSFRLLAIGGALLTGMALVGCGPGTTKRSEGEPRSVADVITQMRTDAKGSLDKMLTLASKPSSVTISFQGTMDGKQTKGHGTIALGGPLKAEVVVQDPTQGEVTVRMLDSTFYVQVPEKDRAGMDGKSWMKMDLSGKADLGQQMSRQLDDLDPNRQLTLMRDSGTLKVVGEERIDGQKTVHYSSSAPLTKYLEKFDPSVRELMQKQLSDKVTDVTTEMWVTEDYRIRRMRVAMGASDMTTDYTDYGKPVNVEAPAPTDVADFNELLKGIGN